MRVKNTTSNQARAHLLGSDAAGILMRIKEKYKERESGFIAELKIKF